MVDCWVYNFILVLLTKYYEYYIVGYSGNRYDRGDMSDNYVDNKGDISDDDCIHGFSYQDTSHSSSLNCAETFYGDWIGEHRSQTRPYSSHNPGYHG